MPRLTCGSDGAPRPGDRAPRVTGRHLESTAGRVATPDLSAYAAAMVRLALASLLFMACSHHEDSREALCARACKKLLDCAHASDKLASCVHACDAPERAQVEAIESASCEALTQGREVPLAQPPASGQ